jgi:zinc/manganese transport system substrate-binding protein
MLGATAAVSACSSSSTSNASSSASPIRIVASTNVYGDIASQIAGSRATITSFITNPSADPHSYEVNPQNQLALSKASIVIENGGGYDDFVDSMLKASSRKSAAVLNVVDISGKKPAAGQELNEHVWYDFPSMEQFATKLAGALASTDPSAAATYQANAQSFIGELKRLEATEASIKATAKGAGVAITEPVPLYLLQACGLVNKTPPEFSAAVEAGTDVAPRVLNDTLTLFTHKQVKLLAYNEQTTEPTTEKVLSAAKANNIAVVPVTETLPSGKDYLSWMAGNLSAVQSALSK